MKIVGANVFVVESPLQLLNAVEAKHHFKLSNNHLVVRIGGTGFSPAALDPMIDAREWDGVHRVSFRGNTFTFKSRLFGARLSALIVGWRYDLQQYLNRRRLCELVGSFSGTRNVFLGNYLQGAQSYMRHLANALAHETLYLLDDGTDVLLIAAERRTWQTQKHPGFGYSRLKAWLRQAVIDWDTGDADRVTFFTAYAVDVAGNDAVIRNEYAHLREVAASSAPSDAVFFLGQTLVEDGYVTEGYYLDYLTRIAKYFSEARLLYVPHPRQSAGLIEQIKRSIGLEIRRFDVPIEYEIAVRGNLPSVVASFFCSALQNCALILGKKIAIKAFYVPPESLLSSHALVKATYEYFENSAGTDVEVVKL